MSSNWEARISTALNVRQAMQALDRRGVFSYIDPEPPASEQQLRSVEERLRYRLDPQYRSFLALANGWPSFFHSVDIFSTHDLTRSSRMDNALSILSVLNLKAAQLQSEYVLPIAMAHHDLDVFILCTPAAPQPGTIVWFAGGEIERFRDFGHLFDTLVEFSRQDLEWLRQTGGADQTDAR